MNRIFALIAVIMTLPLVACGASGGFNVRVDEQYSYLTITLSEQQVRDILTSALENSRDLRVQDPVIDLRPGEIVVTGSVGDGGRLYPGSMSLRAWADSGRLHLEVSTFSFAGFSASQQQIQQFNARMEEGLARRAAESESETSDVTITDTGFEITWRTPRSR